MKKSTKHQLMSPEALDLVAERFKLLGEPIRLRILLNLQAGEMSVGEITEAVESSQPNVSKHLKMMQSADIISRRGIRHKGTFFYSKQSIFPQNLTIFTYFR